MQHIHYTYVSMQHYTYPYVPQKDIEISVFVSNDMYLIIGKKKKEEEKPAEEEAPAAEDAPESITSIYVNTKCHIFYVIFNLVCL